MAGGGGNVAGAQAGDSSVYSKLALNFFYLCFADEGLAVHSAMEALKTFNKKSVSHSGTPKDVLMVSELLVTLKNMRKKIARGKLSEISNQSSPNWTMESPETFAHWKTFLKNFDSESEVVLILRYVLNFSIDVIAQALKVPKGTVYFRIGRGLEFMALQERSNLKEKE